MGDRWSLFPSPFARLTRSAVFRAGAMLLAIAVHGSAAWGGLENWQAIGPEGGNFIWTVTNPSDASRVTAITSNPGYAFHSANGGDSWQRLGEIDPSYVRDVSVFSASKLYAISSTKCYRSGDGGLMWNSSTYPPGGGSYGNAVCAHPTSSSVVYIIGERIASPTERRTVLFKSINGGQSWAASDVFPDKFVLPQDIAVSHTNPGLLYIAGYKSEGGMLSGALVRSTDGGTSWSDITAPIPNAANCYFYTVAVDPTDGNRVYVGGTHFYRSLDGGTSWASEVSFMNIRAIGIDPSDPSKLYAGGIHSLYTSTDYGESWTRQAGLRDAYIQHIEVAPAVSSTVYASTVIGLYKSANFGIDWSDAHNGIFCSVVPALAVAPARPSTVFAERKWAGVMASTNSGDSWRDTSAFWGCEEVHDLLVPATSPGVVLAIEDSSRPETGLYRSENGGGSWTHVDSYLDHAYCLAADPSNPNVIYAGGMRYGSGPGTGGMAVCKSVDGGQTWGTRRDGIPGGGACRDIAVAPSDPQVVYGVGEQSWGVGVFRSEDAGSTWSNVTGNLGTLDPLSLCVYAVCVLPGSADTVVVGTGGEFVAGGIFVTTNGGITWSAAGLAESTRALLYDESAGILYAATESSGVYRSPDGGVSWEAMNDGLGCLNCLCLDLDSKNGYLYVGTEGGGVWRMGTRITTPSAAQGWRHFHPGGR